VNWSSTLLPQTNDPQEIQKAILDLLDKINQLGVNLQATTDSFSGVEPVSISGKYNSYPPVGFFQTRSVNAGDPVYFGYPAGTWEWFVLTDGATIGLQASGINAFNTIASVGGASMNCTVYMKRIE
jgi:hypothetical protein